MAKTTKSRLIYLVLIFALLLRLVAINQSLWLDEAIGAIAARDYSYSGIISEFMKADNHSPLYYILLKFWTSFFGFSELGIRSLAILFSLIAIYFTFKLAKTVTNNNFVSYFAIIFLATSQYFVYFSQEARMYVPASAFAVISIYYFLKTFTEKIYKNWIFFSISLAGLFFIDYVPVFLYPVFIIYALYKRQKGTWWIKFALSHTLLLVLGLLWLPIFLIQLKNSPYTLTVLPAWADLAGGATYKNAALVWMKFTSGRISFFNKSIYYFYVLLVSIPFLIAFYKAFLNKKLFIIKLFYIFPIISLFLASFFFPGFNYFRLTFVYPAFAILIAYGVSNFKFSKLLALIILFFNLISLNIYYFDVNQQREQWRQAVFWVESSSGHNDLALFEFSAPFAPYQWYEKGQIDSTGGLLKITANVEGTEEYIKTLISDRNTVYHFEYLRDLTDPQKKIEKVLIENNYKIVSENAKFTGVGKITKWQR